MAARPAVTLSGQVRVHSAGWFPGLSLLARLSPPSPAHRPLRLQFEGSRGAQEIRSFWQNLEHPAINKQEWSARELGQLQAIAAAHGHLHWQKIADELGVRARGPGRGRGSSGCTSRRGQGCPLELSEVSLLTLSRVWPWGRVPPPRVPRRSSEAPQTPLLL